ncbi:hypothetical protein [Staphylococcus simiae]|uniref:Uncharacterized protein n=1 Tax=Staphylococcus simiae CCM 7213 = CCUG 51256 TaxID=911238 RepID=G5JI59_9STAP|nr:hypothetical protein [Staphylococcus simiae]EHJ08126.1 hypothetical protein SS7213T_05722 [Staphylococcus simiae CCM 7213 = CCUG 51256]PNZ14054.1 hypothetical protein CD113_03165 [Staphylococcus simiae]SNV79796.1 membrane protein [Staphylococcus simiae]
MFKEILSRGIKMSLLFAAAFFIINYFGMTKPDIYVLAGKTVIATLVFLILYIILFLLLNSPERKIKFGTTLPIAILLGIIIGKLFFTIQLGVIAGLILGILAGFIWEFISGRNGED